MRLRITPARVRRRIRITSTGSAATLGGPIRHDKDFFFGSFAGYRFIQYGNYSGSLPTPAQIAGNFSENTPTAAEQANCTTAPSTAANTAVHYLVCNPVTRKPYPNNTLPSVDPTAVNLLNYLVKNLPAQQPAQFGDTRYTYRTRSPLPEQNEEYLIKTDHQITPSHRLTLSYFLLNYKSALFRPRSLRCGHTRTTPTSSRTLMPAMSGPSVRAPSTSSG